MGHDMTVGPATGLDGVEGWCCVGFFSQHPTRNKHLLSKPSLKTYPSGILGAHDSEHFGGT